MTQSTYPLMDSVGAELRAASGRPLTEVTPDALAAGALVAEDVAVNATTLRRQAEIARDAGFVQLADNLTRAAELTAVPNEELLEMYELLRPGRARHSQLLALADKLETTFSAPTTAAYVREVATVYLARGLCLADE